ncbi:FAD/NAD(P)-binding domain-containing protein [Aspergillus ellipticus CBS 707.79]|uniref:FAD/NAD(P)-binding domain-containing protein n=1 Tax=Aspergillus ellipticus CBS 707.79 TaxID=1448320 RepID=A0A319D930_9EURO|nr:FAD/NAD(P)-binding domain-containing protein [Aspergillus ellipticus CBS 707.79]
MPTIVILGASFAGLPLSHTLLAHNRNTTNPSQKIKLILINPTPTFYWAIAAPRILTKPTFFSPDQYLLPIEAGFKAYSPDEFEFVLGRATSIDSTTKHVSVALVDGKAGGEVRNIGYDSLVLATGCAPKATAEISQLGDGESTGEVFPFKSPVGADDTQTAIEAAQRIIAGAKKVVIGGAGPIGIETAGEFADLVSERGVEVTVVSGTERVLSMLKPGASSAAEAALVGKGVRVVRGRKVASVSVNEAAGGGKYIVHLDNGDTIDTDIYIPTTGVVPNNEYIPPAALDPYGWVRVDKELRVEGLEGVYAAGDITMHSQRLAFKAGEMAVVVGANLIADVVGAGKRKTYEQGTSILMLVPIGAGSGTGQMFGWVPWACLVRLVKGRDFLVGRARQVVFG